MQSPLNRDDIIKAFNPLDIAAYIAKSNGRDRYEIADLSDIENKDDKTVN